MKSTLTFAIALALLAQSYAGAAILPQFLTSDGPIHLTVPPAIGGGEDAITDESRSTIARINPATGLYEVAPSFAALGGYAPGDIIFGMITISDIDSSGIPNVAIGDFQQVSIVFSAMVGAPVGGIFSLDAVGSAANPFDLRNLLHADISGVAGLDDDSVFVVVGSETGADPSEGGPAADPLNFDLATATAELLEFNSSNDWSWEVTGGILDGDFFQFAPTDAFGSGSERGGFSVQSSVFPAIYLPVDVAHLGPVPVVTTHDITLFSGAVFASTDAPWLLADEASFAVNAIITPEPGSMLIWAGMGLAGVVGAYRRRQKLAA